SPVPYIIGHLIPVPSETGRSYGDLDEEYLTASYRVVMTEDEFKPIAAYIKHLQANSPLWDAAVYNCITFTITIAKYMGLRVPPTHFMYPETFINKLRELNGGRENQYVKLSDIRARRVPTAVLPTEITGAIAVAKHTAPKPQTRQAAKPAAV